MQPVTFRFFFYFST
ncbi:pheST operon leader peptide PheM [Providencia manganoxydans]